MSQQNDNQTILESASQTISGAAESVKNTLVGAKDAIFGKAEEVKETAKAEMDISSGGVGCESHVAESLVLEASTLKKEACQNISVGEAELQRAQTAQKAAEVMAVRANMMTEEALSKELQGQEKLVAAGNKLMDAGAQLQQEAASMGSRQADINLHATTQIRQDTYVEVPQIPAAELHVLQQRGAAECRPVIEQTYAAECIGGSVAEVQRPVM